MALVAPEQAAVYRLNNYINELINNRWNFSTGDYKSILYNEKKRININIINQLKDNLIEINTILIHFLLTSLLKDLEWENPKINHFDLNIVYINHCFTNVTYIDNNVFSDNSYKNYLDNFHKTHFLTIQEILYNELTSNLFTNRNIRELTLQINEANIGNQALKDISMFVEIFDSSIDYNNQTKNINENTKKIRLLNIIIYDINNCILYVGNTIHTKNSSKNCNKLLNEFKNLNLNNYMENNDKCIVYTKNLSIDGIYKKENNIVEHIRVDLSNIKNYILENTTFKNVQTIVPKTKINENNKSLLKFFKIDETHLIRLMLGSLENNINIIKNKTNIEFNNNINVNKWKNNNWAYTEPNTEEINIISLDEYLNNNNNIR